MNVKFIVKLNFLVLALGLCIYFMYSLHSRGLPNPVLAVFGLPAEKSTPPESINFCKTRVLGLIEPEKIKIIQNGNQWMVEQPEPTPINFIAVEKWLSRFCSIKAKTVGKALPDKPLSPILFIKFIDGSVDILRSDATGAFELGGSLFQSPELGELLAELVTLPAASK